MCIGPRRREIVKFFLNKPGIYDIHCRYLKSLERYCEQPYHIKRELTIHPSSSDSSGSVEYGRNTFTIEFQYNHKNSEHILAHELMHCITVLDGLTLPMRIKDDNTYILDLVCYALVSSITHHMLIKVELERYGYKSELEPHVLSEHCDDINAERAFVLCLIGKSIFVPHCNELEAFKYRVCEQGLEELYDLIRGRFPSDVCAIDHVNLISQKIIHVFQMEENIKLVNLEEYSLWYEEHNS